MKYRIYIDEVGNSDLGSSENPNHRFLSLTGVIISLDYVRKILHPQMEEFKGLFFDHHPDDPVIFHRKEMVNARHPFESLGDVAIRTRFDKTLLELIDSWDYSVISVCLDKKKHKETYTIWRYDPYHYCLAVLLERFILFLKQKDCKGDALAESRGGKEDKRLKESFYRLWKHGTEYISPEECHGVLTSKQLKIKSKKNNIAGLQLADLLAHPSRNEILKENGCWTKETAPFAKLLNNILRSKYYQRKGVVYGKKLL